MRRYGFPLIVIVISSIGLYLFKNYAFFVDKGIWTVILTALALFIFGVYLNNAKSKKSDTWIKKFIVFTFFILLVIMQIGLLRIKFISIFLDVIGADSLIYYMFYIYLGYIFF